MPLLAPVTTATRSLGSKLGSVGVGCSGGEPGRSIVGDGDRGNTNRAAVM